MPEQACVFGTLTGLLGLELAGVHEMFMFLHIRDVMSAATRLNLIGPLEAAGLLHGLGRVASLVLLEAQLKPDDDGHDSGYVHAYASSPLLDALQASHNDMYSRLFSS